MRLLVFVLLFFLTACQSTKSQQNTIPSPLELKADITVSGRVSTLNHIDIVHVGKTIPDTFSEGKISNSRGYNWWVSKHFALKSDFPEHKVRLYLELLEMSYPHYVELFGMAPANIDKKRIAVVYGSSRSRTREAMLDDGFTRGVHKYAGGETMFYNRAGYSFPSHREHHQRYIVIHETMHAFHMALNGHSTWAPNWITEGMADSIASHVYDPDRKQLTVMVFDRAPMNYILSGLQQYHQGGQPSFEAINDDPALKRGLNFFIVHFLLSDPERYHYFKQFIAKLMAANPHSEATLPTANKLLKATFPNWNKLEQAFAQFVSNIQPTFHIVNGPWEQNGAGYWIRNSQEDEYSRLDIIPNGRNTHPVMDFPTPAKRTLVSVKDDKQLGFKIAFQPEQLARGAIGFAFITKLSQASIDAKRGLISESEVDYTADQLFKVVVVDGVKIQLSHSHHALPEQQIALSPDIKNSLKNHPALGITVTHSNNSLAFRLTTNSATQSFSVAVSSTLSKQIDLQSISLIAKNNNHLITPYLFTHQYPIEKVNTANPWYFEQAPLLGRAFETCDAFKQQLIECEKQLEQIYTLLPEPNKHSTLALHLETQLNNWQRLLGNKALWQLSGIRYQLYFQQNSAYLYLINPSNDIATMAINEQQAVQLRNGEHRIKLHANSNVISLKWRGLEASFQLAVPNEVFDGVILNAKLENNLLVTLTGPYSGASNGTIRVNFIPYSAPSSATLLWQKQVDFKPYQKLLFTIDEFSEQKHNNGLLEIIGEFEVDGETIRLLKHIDL
ncbi:hypothetical protein ACSLBF_07590 [Pseudoalteromonas sp. T1lg65]|uniref:hypothetical protein n=1 Tax=Pseudoalteromonas sp. T1lg65 TaxID=2077101 RepID=UPI003F79D2C0